MEVTEKHLLRFIEEKFPDVYVALLTGSMVDGFANAESDYDLYIITNTRDFAFTESFIYRGRVLQAIHLPLGKIDQLLLYDINTKTGIHLGSFAKGKILIDKYDYLLTLIGECKDIFTQGPGQSSYNELKLSQTNVLNLISDLSGNNLDEEKTMICYDLYKAFIKFYLSYNGHWNSSGKHLARQFKKANADLSEKLINAMTQFHQSMNPENLLSLIKLETSFIGSNDSGYSINSGLINVKSNYLVCYLYGSEDLYFLSNIVKTEFIDMNPEIIGSFTFLSRAFGDHDNISEGLYAVIEVANVSTANDYLIPYLEKRICKLTENDVKFHYPINFDFAVTLGGERVLPSIFKLFATISNNFHSELLNQNESIIYSLFTIKKFRKVFFTEVDIDWMNFLQYINRSWISRGYDNGRIHTISQINNARDKLLNKFSIQYHRQSDILIEIYRNSDDYSDRNGLNFRSIEAKLRTLKDDMKLQLKVKSRATYPQGDSSEIPVSWVVYKNIIDYILGIYFLKESQKSYIAYILIELAKTNRLDT